MRSSQRQSGFTFLEVLVGSALFLLVAVGVFGAYQLGLKVIGQSKNKVTAMAIATGELELIKSLPYSSVGIDGGFPDGDLESQKVKTVNGTDYTVDMRVDYVIDAADGLSGPEDDCPNDYKKAEVKVSWSSNLSGDIKITADIAPSNLAEECDEGGGILLISVFDAFGVPVPSPLIEIKDKDTDQLITNAIPSSGSHFFSVPTDTYKVEVTKSGYSSKRTYGIEEIVSPENPHLAVLENNLTDFDFSIDKLSSFMVEAVGPESLEYPPIPNASFDLRGAKTIGANEEEEPVYKYLETIIVDQSGQETISGLEWDSYAFTINDLDLVAIESPAGAEVSQPVGLNPDETLDIRLILQAENSLLTIVRDSVTLEPIFSADIRLYNAGIFYDVVQYSDEDGRTYFIPLENGSYNLDIDISGYQSYSGNINVSGDESIIIDLVRTE